MTTLVLTFLLERELNKINRDIDAKIQSGKSYKKEARLHKQIVTRISKLKNQKNILAMV